ncbi:MAG: DUF6335 family protein [Acidobacteriota bacterium]
MKRRAPAKQTSRKAAPARARTKAKAKTAANTRKKASKSGKAGRKAAQAATKTAGLKPRTKAGLEAARSKAVRNKSVRNKNKKVSSHPTDVVQSPPSSLDMVRRGTAARTGRAELAERRHNEQGLSPDIAAGDLDVKVEDAYFTGDEAPGGDNTTPDQDVVDEIGRALGVEYDDDEELKSTDKVANRDKHRWELDPASAEDYRDKK